VVIEIDVAAVAGVETIAADVVATEAEIAADAVAEIEIEAPDLIEDPETTMLLLALKVEKTTTSDSAHAVKINSKTLL
jgi:hypothetical protein